MTIQLTIIRIEGYGPWTLTLGSDREAHLQMLQAKVYHDIQSLFTQRNGLVYPNRFDEYFAISNNISVRDHALMQKELEQKYKEIKLSMTIGIGNTPFEANLNAYDARKNMMIIDSDARIFGHNHENVSNGSIDNNNDNNCSNSSSNSSSTSTSNNMEIAQIMHIDVDGSAKVSARLSPYEITAVIARIYSKLSEEFLKKKALTFFLGGDNFMVISNGLTKKDAESIINNIIHATGLKLNCGIGTGKSGREAAAAATKALDTVRDLRDEGKIQSIYEIQCP